MSKSKSNEHLLEEYIKEIHHDKNPDEIQRHIKNFRYPNLIYIKNINSPQQNLYPNMIFRFCAYKDSIPKQAKNIGLVQRGVDYGESVNSTFNNNLSSWCVQSVTAYTGFNTQSVLSGANLPPFGTSTNCN